MHTKNTRLLTKFLKAIANERRLKVVLLLIENQHLTVSEIAQTIRLSFRSTSHHLKILRAAEIVEFEQRGPEMHYTLNSDQVQFDLLRIIARRCS